MLEWWQKLIYAAIAILVIAIFAMKVAALVKFITL